MRPSLALVPLFALATSARGQSAMDLHSHSYCSDGLKTPEALVQQAKSRGLSVFALSDHDSTKCLERARREADRLGGITLVPAIEIGAGDDSIHLLGLGIDPSNAALKGLGDQVPEEHVQRAKKMIASLAALGMQIDFKVDLVLPRMNAERRADGLAPLEAEQAAGMSEAEMLDRIRGHILLPDLAKAMVARGYVSSVQDAFGKYIGDEAPNSLKIPMSAPTFQEAIAAIHAAGGIAILAHPYTVYKYKKFPRQFSGKEYLDFETLAADLLEAGLDGFEFYKPGWERFAQDNARVQAVVASYQAGHAGRGLLLTPGSDYHGYDQPGGVGPQNLGGMSFPDSEADRLKRALRLP